MSRIRRTQVANICDFTANNANVCRAKVAADNYEESHRSGNGEAGGIESEKQKAERRRAAKKAQDAASSEDIVTRVSNKVGNKINEIDGKIVDAGKKAVD